MTVAEPVLARANVERVIGRELRPAERPIDVLKLNAALERAKDELERAIRAEMLLATRRWLRSHLIRPRLALTEQMRKPLLTLERIGREEARRELDRIGVPARAHAAPNPHPRVAGVGEAVRTVEQGLPALGARIADGLVHADLADASSAAIARALLAVPGARDIASRVVSTALMSGMSLTFEQAGDLVAGWEYTAVLDSSTCEECEPLDGEQFPTWEAIQEVLPNGGPNPLCLGGGRCRCRAVPTG
jgi:hypothetical protein